MTLFGFVLFIHVVCIATWFGGASMMAMYLRDATRSNNLETMTYALGKAHRWNMTMFIPTSVLVLLSGMYLLVALNSFGHEPLWLIVKERFGSLFVIAFILVIAFYGKKLLRQVKESGVDSNKGQALLKRYIMILNISLLCMAVLIFFVTTKIGS